MHVVVSGSTGLIGSALMVSLAQSGHTVARLQRGDRRGGAHDVLWDPATGSLEPPPSEPFDALVHLAGENIGRAWTQARRAAIRQSRVDVTERLCRTLATMQRPPGVLICASAVGYYGDRGDEELDESAAPGRGFLAEVCRQWEAATEPAAAAGIRTVRMRLAVILDPRSGPLARMLPLFAAGLGGRLGSGRQFMSWVTLADVVRAVALLLERDDLSGPVNIVAPQSVTNAEFTKVLASVLHRPAILPAPAFVLRMILGLQADELLLASARVVPRRLVEAGFQFQNPSLRAALEQLLPASRRR
jgi:uncharacterized protein (TIGR01777 family)